MMARRTSRGRRVASRSRPISCGSTSWATRSTTQVRLHPAGNISHSVVPHGPIATTYLHPLQTPNPAIGAPTLTSRAPPPPPHTPFNTVSTGDRKNGYPDMTVAQLSDALDARYAAKKLPAERHVQQLMAKVATAEDASLAAATLARFHHHRAAAFASMNLPRSRHGLTPQ